MRTHPMRPDDSAVWHGFTNMRRFLQFPICITEADGVWIRDAEGNTYLNAFSSLVNLSLGAGQSEIVERIAAQARKLPYFTIERATHEAAEEFASRLIEKTPPGLTTFFMPLLDRRPMKPSLKLSASTSA